MSDDTTPIGDATEPAPDAAASGDSWSTRRKVLAGAAVVAFVLVAVGGALLAASGSDDDNSPVSADESTTSSTGVTTTTVGASAATATTSAQTAVGSGTAATPTTKPAQVAATTPQPGITMPDEPSFTSVSVPSSFTCPPAGAAEVVVSWKTVNATSVRISTSAGQNSSGAPASGYAGVNVPCANGGPTSMGIQFTASGPGGTGVATRTMSITH